jgi:hypothetical protein
MTDSFKKDSAVMLALSGRAEIPATLPSDKREKYQGIEPKNRSRNSGFHREGALLFDEVQPVEIK